MLCGIIQRLAENLNCLTPDSPFLFIMIGCGVVAHPAWAPDAPGEFFGCSQRCVVFGYKPYNVMQWSMMVKSILCFPCKNCMLKSSQQRTLKTPSPEAWRLDTIRPFKSFLFAGWHADSDGCINMNSAMAKWENPDFLSSTHGRWRRFFARICDAEREIREAIRNTCQNVILQSAILGIVKFKYLQVISKWWPESQHKSHHGLLCRSDRLHLVDQMMLLA